MSIFGGNTAPDGSPDAAPTFRALNWIVRLNVIIGSVLVLCLVGLVAMEVTARVVFDYSFDAVEELSGYFLVAIVFLALPICVRQEALLQVDFFVKRAPARLAFYFDFVFNVASILFTLVLIWYLLQQVISTYVREMVASTTLGTPLWIPQVFMPLGGVLLLIALIEVTWNHVRKFLAARDLEKKHD